MPIDIAYTFDTKAVNKNGVTYLRTPITLNAIQRALISCKNVIVEGADDSYKHLFEKYQGKTGEPLFFLCLTNTQAFKLDITTLVENYLSNYLREVTTKESLLISMERIKTSFHEAFSNAFMWSNMELTSCEGIRELEFYEELDEKLATPTYGNRFISIYAIINEGILELGIGVQGIPISWPNKVDEFGFRGITLIRTLSDDVIFDNDAQGIILRFDIRK